MFSFHVTFPFELVVGDSRLAPISGRQLDSKPLGNTNCRPTTGSELPNGNATVDENPSAKGCPPFS
jgi:hypothetical protein